MENDIDTGSYGLVAFDILRQLLPRMAERDLITKTDLIALLKYVARQNAAHGVTLNNDVATGAARLASKLAIELDHAA